MASVTRESNGRRTIQFVSPDGKRKSVRLGKVSQRVAETIKIKLESLAAALLSGGAVDDETARWAAALPNTLHERLAAAGLVKPRGSARLGSFIDGFIESRGDTKEATRTVFKRVQKHLVKYFGVDKLLREVTAGDADAWRLWLTTKQELAENTVRRHTGIARQFLKTAVRRELLNRNPFEGLTAVVRGNPAKFRYVTVQETAKLIEAAPDAQWRCIIALARYGGLRVPSELLGLTWADVDWERNRVRVTSPKTEHHPGRGERWIPLFPELLPYLRECFEEAKPGDSHVITRYRDTNQNLRTTFAKIIARAGLTTWPKPFQNLRSSRATELRDTWPAHVCTAWLGHCDAVAQAHYLQVTDAHFALAAGGGLADKNTESALQNPVQQPLARARNGSQADFDAGAENAVSPDSCETLRNLATPCEIGERRGLGVTGLEPCDVSGSGDNELAKADSARAAESGAVGARDGAADGGPGPGAGPGPGPGAVDLDPALTRLVRAWPGLAEHLKAAILAIVQAGAGGTD